jgi:hypothetical protein
VRVKGGIYAQALFVKGAGNHECNFVLRSQDYLSGSLPTWLVNWATQKSVPGLLGQLNAFAIQLREGRAPSPSTQSNPK